MTHKTHTAKTFFLVLVLCFASAGTAAAAGAPAIDPSLLSWDAEPGYRLTLTVSGAGQAYRQELKAGEPATFAIFDDAGQPLADGQYAWQLTAAPALSKEAAAVLTEARAAGVSLSGQAGGFTESGYFTVAGGAFVTPSAPEGAANKAHVIADDLIVDGSACIGIDCVSGESFGFDTLRLKENNLRIKFQDTSASASFPSNDWQLTANDSTNGGANKFSIDDIDSGKTPFTVEAGAPNNALYVADEGNLGLGTATPVVDIHAVNGNTPTLRLEQDGSSGFTPQTWDMAGNEANFFIRDVTNGSKLPFRIKPGAGDDSISIDADGDIGMGLQTAGSTTVNSNQARLHVRTTDSDHGGVLVENASTTAGGRAMLEIKNNGSVRFDQVDTSTGVTWRATNGANRYRIIDMSDPSTVEFDLEQNGDLTISGTLVTGGPSCMGGCDRVFASDYELPTIEEHAAQMWEKGYLPQVGPTQPKAPINLSEKTGDILNELEKAHIYIEQLNNGLKDKEERITQLEEALAQLKELVEAR